MRWHSPLAFLLLVLWLALFVYYFFYGRRRSRGAFRLSVFRGFGWTWRAFFSELPVVLHFICLLFLILALARPLAAGVRTRRSAEGVDIMVVLDTSDSMLIEDMRPGSRIEAAKRVIGSFINGLSHDRVGLIVFAGESYTRVPLTLDYPVLLNSLHGVHTSHYDPYLKPGTAIGVALAGAAARLRGSQAKSRVVIFLTDGENNTGFINPQTALEIIKQYKIKLYTIGVGAKEGSVSKIPRKVVDPLGRTRVVYHSIKSEMNEKLLKHMAEVSGGMYFYAGDGQALRNIFAQISRLEKSPVEAVKWMEYKDLFPNLLKQAVWFYLAGGFLMLTLFWRIV